MKEVEELQCRLSMLKQNIEEIDYIKKYALTNLRIYPNQVRELMNQVLEIGIEIDSARIIAEALIFLGWCNYDQSFYEVSSHNFEEAKSLFESIKDPRGIVRACNGLIMNYIEIGLFNEAIENGIKGVELAEKHNDQEMILVLLLNTTSAYMELGSYDLAWKQIPRIKQLEAIMNKQDKITFNILLIEVAHYQKDYELVAQYCEVVRGIVGDNAFYMAYIYCHEGKNAYHMGKYEEAISRLNISINYAQACGGERELVETLRIYAKVLIEQGKFEEAEEKLLEAIKKAEALKMKVLLVKIYDILNNMYATKKEYAKAYEALQKYVYYQKVIEGQSGKIISNKLEYMRFKYKVKEVELLWQNMQNVSEVGKNIITSLKMTKTLDKIYTKVQELVDADVFIIGIYDNSKQKLNYDLVFEKGEPIVLAPIHIDEPNSLGGYCIKNKVSIHIHTMEEEMVVGQKGYIVPTNSQKQIQSIIYHPLVVRDQVLGVLGVQHYEKNWFSTSDFEALKHLAEYVSIAIHNAKLFEQVNYLAKHDELTGVYQRREVIKRAESMQHKKKTGDVLYLIMLDIDYFKHINDTYGHLAGDEVLKLVASHLQNHVGRQGVVGRYGGEEFIIACLQPKDFNIIALGERIRESIEQKRWFITNEVSVQMTVSIGIHRLKEKESIVEGLKCADKVLYHAKNDGRNRVYY